MHPVCSVCKKAQSEETTIRRCSRCLGRFYCGVYTVLTQCSVPVLTVICGALNLGTDCQKADWKAHRPSCGMTLKWYDKHRKCRDGRKHEGNLELITWPNAKEGTGWGHVAEGEAEDLRTKFEVEFGGDEQKLYNYWPQAFRWTCCGTDAGMDWGCDHHGSGGRAWTCDYCRMGQPLPDNIYRKDNASRHGLNLRRGPDPRSRFEI